MIKYYKYIFITVLTLILMLFLVLSLSVIRYRSGVMDFWGGLYEESNHDLFTEFPLNIVMIEGGPSANPQMFNVCKGTLLPLVPVKRWEDNKFVAFCGFDVKEETQVFTLDDKDLLKAFSSEYGGG